MTSIEELEMCYEERLAEAVAVAAENHALDWHYRVNPQCPQSFECPRYQRAIRRFTETVLRMPPDRQRAYLERGGWESWYDIAREHDTPPESPHQERSDGTLILDLTLEERL